MIVWVFNMLTITPVFYVLSSWTEAWWNSTGNISQRKAMQNSGFLYNTGSISQRKGIQNSGFFYKVKRINAKYLRGIFTIFMLTWLLVRARVRE